MKKSGILTFILAVATASLSVYSAGCSVASLNRPSGLTIDDNNRLSWESVEDARNYVVEISGAGGRVSEETRRASLSLSSLEAGDYEIKIKAESDGKSKKSSDWSETVYFHRDYETGCLYTLVNDNTEYEITGVGSASGEVVLDSTYRGKPVTAIADKAFRGSRGLEKLVLCDSITSIGNAAFYNCVNLSSVTLTDNITYIGESAFQSCSALTEITIPKNVKEIKDYTFAYCRALEKVELSNVTSINKSAFSNCDAIKEIVLPETLVSLGNEAFSYAVGLESLTVGSSVEKLGNSAFIGCTSLTEIGFAENSSLKEIGQLTFAECSALASVELPAGLETVGYGSFVSCTELENVTLPAEVTRIGGIAFSGTKLYNEALKIQDSVYVGNWLIGISQGVEGTDAANVTITDVNRNTLREGTVGIADSVFVGCPKLTRVELPQSVQYIGNYSFMSCENLYRFESEGLKVIGQKAFEGCTALSRLTLNEGLESIEDYAFKNCARLSNTGLATKSMIPSSVTHIGKLAFSGTRLWGEPDEFGVIYAGHWVVGFNYVRSNIAIKSPYARENENSPVNIADYAFFAFDYWAHEVTKQQATDPETGVVDETLVYPLTNIGISSVQGMQNVKYMGKGAFYGCYMLTSAYLDSNGFKDIPDYAFYGCESLERVYIPKTLETVGRSAFYNCKQLRYFMNQDLELILPDAEGLNLNGSGVTDIGDYAFKDCAFKSADLGTEIKSVGNAAFYNNAELEKLVVADNSAESLSYLSFAECANLKRVELGEGLTGLGKAAFYNCTSLKEAVMPRSLKTVGDYAFFKCDLGDASFGQGIENIGNYAFAYTKMKSVLLPESVKSIGAYAFRGAASEQFVFGGSVQDIADGAFYNCYAATIYGVSAAKGEKWSDNWNSSYRPAAWGCTLSADGSYVVSLTAGGKLENAVNTGGYAVEFGAPVRSGYVFVGWATEANATAAEYSASDVVNAPEGTVLYSVWIRA